MFFDDSMRRNLELESKLEWYINNPETISNYNPNNFVRDPEASATHSKNRGSYLNVIIDFIKYTIINKGTKFVNSKGKVILDWPRPRKVTENGWYPSYRFNQPDLERQLRKKLKNYKKVSIRQNSEVKKRFLTSLKHN